MMTDTIFLRSTNEALKAELVHYGVLGMRWGVRKDEKSSGNRRNASKEKSKRRQKLETRYQTKKGMNAADAEKAATKQLRVEKILAATAAVTLVAATIYAVKHKDQVDKLLRTINPYGITTKEDLEKGSGVSSNFQADLAMSNPNVMKNKAYQANCANCVTAYELRRRGFDVEALPMKGDMNNTLKFLESFNVDDPKVLMKKSNVYAKATKEALSWGEGGRGVVIIDLKDSKKNVGHIFSVEVQNGRPMFIDPQSGLVYGLNQIRDRAKNYVIMARLDNREFSDRVYQAIRKRKV